MPETILTTEKLYKIIDLARLAPSVHNAQPWLVHPSNNDLVASIDPRHALTYGDPTGRQTVISLGIFTEAIIIAAKTVGLDAKTVKFENKKVTLEFQENSSIDAGDTELLKRRSSDRSVFSPVDIPGTLQQQLGGCSKSSDVSVRLITDKPTIDVLAELTAKGISLALSHPEFRKELSEYLVVPWSSKRRGISTKSLYLPEPLGSLQPKLVKRPSSRQNEAKLERKRWESASGVVIISADGDLDTYWFDVGRSYLRASLVIESAELSQATSAAIVEASNYHEDIEKILHIDQRILAVIRVGKGSSKRHYSPRVTAEELIT